MSICLTGWPGLNENVVWSPGFDSPTWPSVLSDFVTLELELMVKANGTDAVMSREWPFLVFVYVEYYVRSLMKIELNGEFIQPWWQTMESAVLDTFQPYNMSSTKLIQKYANELLRLSSCGSGWPNNSVVSV